MKRYLSMTLFAAVLLLGSVSLSPVAQAEEVFRLRMFFGLSIGSGGGVSLAEWQAFEEDDLAKTFDGFNVVDSVGYWKGKPERSKVVTIIAGEGDMPKAKALAARYAKRFNQESVMLVKIPVEEWSFVGADG